MSAAAGAGPLVPTFHGFVHNSMDGLVLFEACLSGKLHHVPRRPHDRERSSLIKSGSIFIYEENASGIKRWTDGVAWSPSRILGNFLIYRELEKPFPPGEKKRAMKRKRTSMPGEPYPRRESDDVEVNEPPTPVTPPTPTVPGGEAKPDASGSDQDKELERSLIGSLVDSYGFRPDGLVKKTMSININGISHHMVSYYKVDDVKNNLLTRPLSDVRLQNISVRPELYLKQNFRAPVEENEHYAIDHQMHAHPAVWSSGGMYGVRPGQYFANPQYPVYAVSAPPGGPVYGGIAGTTAWPQPQGSSGAPMYSAPPYQPQGYPNYYKTPAPTASAPGPQKEDNQPSAQSAPYSGGQYPAPPPTTPSSYPGMQRNGSQSTPGAMYPNPVAPGSSSYGSMNAANGRPSYSPTTNGQSQSVYGGSSGQPYAVRSPTQSYGMHNPPSSAVSQSPHATVKSPQSAHPNTPAQSINPDHNAQMHSQQMSYRPSSYQVPPTPQSAHPSNDMNGLGISNSSNYSGQAQSGQSYNYGSSSQAFRPVADVSAGSQSGGPYGS